MISGAVGFENPAIAAQQIESQQIGDRGAIGEASSLDPGRTSVGNLPAEFGEQPGLADAGLADEADGLAMPVFDLPKKIVQDRELALAIDKNRRARRWRLAQPGAAMRHPEQTISRDRLGLAFENERSDRLDPRIALRQQAGRFAQQDRSRLGGLLKPGRHIGRITDDRVVHRQIVGDRAEDDRTRVDANSHGQLEELGSAAAPPSWSARCMARAANNARLTWSSWVSGAPNRAMNPSPVNCGAVPP